MVTMGQINLVQAAAASVVVAASVAALGATSTPEDQDTLEDPAAWAALDTLLALITLVDRAASVVTDQERCIKFRPFPAVNMVMDLATVTVHLAAV